MWQEAAVSFELFQARKAPFGGGEGSQQEFPWHYGLSGSSQALV